MDKSQLGTVIFVCIAIPFVFFMFWLYNKEQSKKTLPVIKPSQPTKPPEQKPTVQIDDTKCPFCHGDIEPGVKKCKHCGEWLDEEHRKKEEIVQKAQLETAKSSKSTNQAIGWIVFILFGIPALVALLRGC